jgi:uncharacterized protein YkwD
MWSVRWAIRCSIVGVIVATFPHLARALPPSAVPQASSGTCQYPSLKDRVTPEASKKQLVDLVNTYRRSLRLPSLHVNAALGSSAQNYSNEMWARDFFSHNDPLGHSLGDRIAASGYLSPSRAASNAPCRNVVVGENLAEGMKTPQQTFNAWLHSPPHQRLLRNPHFTETGIGITGPFWVEHFASTPCSP